MCALELHYGDKNSVARKVNNDLKSLPTIDSGKITMLQFSSKLQNAILTFKKYDLVGYLHSPDLIQLIGKKLPSALKYAYMRFLEESSNEKSEIEIIGEFLNNEAKRAKRNVMFDCEMDMILGNFSTVDKANSKNKNVKSCAVYATSNSHEQKRANLPIGDKKAYIIRECVVCMRGNHYPSECALFKSEKDIEKRWTVARKNKLCFLCLKKGHPCRKCYSKDKIKCAYCNEPHNTLLHVDSENNSDKICIVNTNERSEI